MIMPHRPARLRPIATAGLCFEGSGRNPARAPGTQARRYGLCHTLPGGPPRAGRSCTLAL